MKNYEEMAQSVLKRRDMEIKRRKRALLIGTPCAAALLVGVVGIGVVAASQSRGFINPVVDEIGTAVNNTATDAIGHDLSAITAEIETAPALTPGDNAIGSNDIAVEIDPPAIDYTNPNAGEYKKVLTYIDYPEPKDEQLDLDENDFTPYSLEQLDPFYGLRFNRLAALYPEWTLSYDKLGVYRHETNDGVIASLELVSTLNTLNYTTENGGTVSVSAQYKAFETPMIGDQKTTLERRKAPWTYPEVQYEYDADGNIIGASTPPYDPTASSAPAVNTDAPVANAAAPSTHFDADSLEDYDVVSEIDLISNPENSDLFTQINGYDALVLAVQYNNQRVDHYVAYINMSSHVRITAYGVTRFEFEEILDNYTNNVEGPIKSTHATDSETDTKPADYTNPKSGINDINVLDIDKFNIAEESVDLSSMTFFEYDLEELGLYYGLNFNRLEDLHPNWKMSHDNLGLYNVKFEVIGGITCTTLCGVEEYDINTLNYTTDSGALITVSAKQGKFESVSKEVFTHDKPTDPSKFTSETTYDENGNPDGTMVYPIDPNDWRPEPDEGVSTVNGYEALIYRDADGNFLADIDIASRVRITAEGLSEEEFLKVLDDFTK